MESIVIWYNWHHWIRAQYCPSDKRRKLWIHSAPMTVYMAKFLDCNASVRTHIFTPISYECYSFSKNMLLLKSDFVSSLLKQSWRMKVEEKSVFDSLKGVWFDPERYTKKMFDWCPLGCFKNHYSIDSLPIKVACGGKNRQIGRSDRIRRGSASCHTLPQMWGDWCNRL